MKHKKPHRKKITNRQQLPYINAINLSDKIRWWQDGGNFNGELFLKFCEIKNKIPN